MRRVNPQSLAPAKRLRIAHFMRTARIERNTAETKILVEINLDGTGTYDVSTGIGFLDHMVEQFSRHSLIDVTMKIDGDLHVDQHHTTEDSALALGQALVWAGLFYIFPAMLLRWEAGLGWARADLALGITMSVLASGLVAPLAGPELRETCEARRSQRQTQRAMKSNAAICVSGIITFGHEAQPIFAALTSNQQDAAYREVAEAIAGNLCRCTGYEPIINAILDAAATMRRRGAA